MLNETDPEVFSISCLITDIINLTLATCDYTNCTEECEEYLMAVANECPVVFHNEVYLHLWDTLYRICNEIGEQSSPFYLDQ